MNMEIIQKGYDKLLMQKLIKRMWEFTSYLENIKLKCNK